MGQQRGLLGSTARGDLRLRDGRLGIGREAEAVVCLSPDGLRKNNCGHDVKPELRHTFWELNEPFASPSPHTLRLTLPSVHHVRTLREASKSKTSLD